MLLFIHLFILHLPDPAAGHQPWHQCGECCAPPSASAGPSCRAPTLALTLAVPLKAVPSAPMPSACFFHHIGQTLLLDDLGASAGYAASIVLYVASVVLHPASIVFYAYTLLASADPDKLLQNPWSTHPLGLPLWVGPYPLDNFSRSVVCRLCQMTTPTLLHAIYPGHHSAACPATFPAAPYWPPTSPPHVQAEEGPEDPLSKGDQVCCHSAGGRDRPQGCLNQEASPCILQGGPQATS